MSSTIKEYAGRHGSILEKALKKPLNNDGQNYTYKAGNQKMVSPFNLRTITEEYIDLAYLDARQAEIVKEMEKKQKEEKEQKEQKEQKEKKEKD